MKPAKGDALGAVDTAIAGLRCADRALPSPTPHCAWCSGVVLTAHLHPTGCWASCCSWLARHRCTKRALARYGASGVAAKSVNAVQ